MVGKASRSYEVSVWTLQDSFITVLKPANVESKGTIQETDFVIKDDGENTFSFRIPMYVNELETMKDSEIIVPKESIYAENAVEGKQELFSTQVIYKPNPIWENTINGTIIADMRKIKVIFNKNTIDEKVFEFIILKVTESHEGYEKYCQVECEGLAFNELGKQGYKISLEGVEEIQREQEKWEDNGAIGEMPMATINYWADKVFRNTNWSYEVRMDWSGYDPTWSSNKIYEEAYTSSWYIPPEGGEKLIPENIMPAREKYRMVEASESNRYNLSQTIAEAFEVFCRYEYEYDDNYHIIGRKAIFYNNFLNEKEGIIDFTYKYNTRSIKREMDSNDLCSKMFVSRISNTDLPSGEVGIMDSYANKSLEDYLLNFDYLYSIGTITEEQYKEKDWYEMTLRNLNIDYIAKTKELNAAQSDLNHFKAVVQNAKDASTSAYEAMNHQTRLRDALMEKEEDGGLVTIDSSNPGKFFFTKSKDEELYSANVTTLGIDSSTLRLYQSFDPITKELSYEVFGYSLEKDEHHNIVKITNVSEGSFEHANGKKSLYGTYRYYPEMYYDKVITTYTNLKDYNDGIVSYYTIKPYTDEQGIYHSKSRMEEKEELVENLQTQCKELLTQKQEAIDKFERFLGPALREGTWQPEDEYAKYSEPHRNSFVINTNAPTYTSLESEFIFDSIAFDDEQKITYQFGVNLESINYPMISLQGVNIPTDKDNEFYSRLAFVYSDAYLTIDENGNVVPLTNNGSIASKQQAYSNVFFINSTMHFCFIKRTETSPVEPVLIITGLKNLTESELDYITNNINANARVSIINYSEDGVENETTIIKHGALNWIITPLQSQSGAYLPSHPIQVFPRYQINSNKLVSYETGINIYVGNEKREVNEDFYTLARADSYYTTLKPELVLQNWNKEFLITYSISSAAEAIYLDAINVLKENAFPKVSYTIEPISINKDFIYNAYARLGQIAHINDNELMFENVMGYISELQLNLDKPWEDKVVIKNYKTKFEDLFSNIVAQTEQMKKNAYLINMLSEVFDSNGKLAQNVVDDIELRLPVGLEKIITPAEAYAEVEPYIREQLKQSFENAAAVISKAIQSVNDVNDLVIDGADILSGFKEDIKASLTVTSFIDNASRQRISSKTNKPSEFFKVGDKWTHSIWVDKNTHVEIPENKVNTYPANKRELITNIYLATMNSNEIEYNAGEELTSIKGWTKVSDGRLAGLTGAAIQIDSDSGNIALTAGNTISILAKTKLDLASEDVFITGNNSVNIGSKYINISANNGGINIVDDQITENDTTNDSGLIEGHTSCLRFNKDGILIASAAGVDIKSAKGINIYSSTNQNATAISISEEKGIFIGSGKEIQFYAGDVIVTRKSDGSIDTITGSGSASKFNKDRILFGVTDGQQGSALDITKDEIIIGSAFINSDGSINATKANKIGKKGGGTGVTITKESIELATGDDSINSYIGMTKNGIIVSNQSSLYSGGFVQIDQHGVLIGTAKNGTSAEIDTETHKDAIKRGEKINPTAANGIFQVYAPNFVVDNGGILYAYGAYISGEIMATKFTLGEGQTIPKSGVDGLETNLNTLTTNLSALGITVDKINAISGKEEYAVSNQGINPPSSGWKKLSEVTITDSNPWLWARTTITYSGGNQSVTYTVSYKGKDGNDGKYVSSIQQTYYLYNANTLPLDKWPADGTEIKSTGTGPNYWTLAVPEYIENYYYFRSEQYKWSDNTITHSKPYVDYGITVANKKATSASKQAATLAGTYGEIFTTDGLVSYGDYNVALLSDKKLLIGANSGIDIWNTNDGTGGAAISLTNDEIALHGAKINITSSSDTGTSVVALDEDGITLGASGKLECYMTNFTLDDKGNLHITGEVNATTGSIAGWTINEQGIVKAVWINGKQNPMVDPNIATNCWYFSGFASPGAITRNIKVGNALESLGYSLDEQVALAIGGPTSDDWSISPFHVLQNGKLYASGAEITGNTKINTSGNITLSGGQLIFNSQNSGYTMYIENDNFLVTNNIYSLWDTFAFNGLELSCTNTDEEKYTTAGLMSVGRGIKNNQYAWYQNGIYVDGIGIRLITEHAVKTSDNTDKSYISLEGDYIYLQANGGSAGYTRLIRFYTGTVAPASRGPYNPYATIWFDISGISADKTPHNCPVKVIVYGDN